MGTGRTFNKAPKTRPKKGESERRRRDKVQSQRVVALGYDVETVRKMEPGQRRTILQRPVKYAITE